MRNPRIPINDRLAGFALVTTVALMVLLSLLAIGLLSLSTVSLRASGGATAEAEARANARMALVLAIGELQRTMGPDGRITAPASILDEDPESLVVDGVTDPQLTGVWEARQDQLGDLPDYDRSGPFQRWLVSDQSQSGLRELDAPRSDSLTDPVILVPEIENEEPLAAVRAGRVATEQGAFAWWVGDENVKARVGLRDDFDRDGDGRAADHLAAMATPGSHGLRALEEFKDYPTNTETSDRAISRGTFDLTAPEGAVPGKFFHDLSPYSESVLANVTKGELRKDLSLFLERDDLDWLEGWGWPAGKRRAPAGPLGPNQEIALSPPDEYDVLSWKSLHHWTSMHRRQIGSSRNFQLESMRNYTALDPVDNVAWNSGVLRIAPVMVRMQMILSFGVKKRSDGGRNPNTYELFMYSYPVVTLWNPYSVALKVDQWSVFLHTFPLEHTIYKNGRKHVLSGSGSRNGNYNWGWPAGNMVMRFGDAGVPGIELEPGQAKTLTYTKSSQGGFHAHDMIDGIRAWLPPGRSDPDGHVGQPRSLGTISARSTDRIEIETKGSSWNTSSNSYNRFQTTFGFRCEPKSVHRGHPERFKQQMFCGQVCWRRETDLGNPVADFISRRNFPSKTFDEIDDAPSPFIHLDVRMKTMDEPRLPNKTWLHTIPGHPYVSATSTQKHGRQGVDATTTFFAHPYTVEFEQVSGLEGLIQNTPFFGPSNRPGGRSRIVAQDIPMAPLASLAQLQNLPQLPIEALNWSGYYHQNHAIGNSFASPGLSPEQVKRRSFPFYLGEYFAWQGGDLSGKFYDNWEWFNNADYTISTSPASIVDRSYAANHLLFDDYFFSSIATQEGPIFRSFGTERSAREVAQQFFNGEKPLPNAAYQPYQAGTGSSGLPAGLFSRSGATELASERIASHLMVSGGFNVNSTSVAAWKALLASSHLRKPVIQSSRGGLSVRDEASFVVSRFSAPLRGAADNSSGAAAEENRWLGYRELTEQEIDELARAMVKQVKKRGPFRSLGEFVNRRLYNDPELALYGALQAALEDPEVSINENYRNDEITEANLRVQGTSVNYPFLEAALGSRYQGTPAYISQADILTPIAPILNARSDTFTIRAYGEARSADGSEVVARAWCEAVIQRVPEYLDPADEAYTPLVDLDSETNRNFGRKMIMKTFRWMTPGELESMGGGA